MSWDWDATSATVQPTSASLVQGLLGYGGPRAYFMAEVAHAEVSTETITYPLHGSQNDGLDQTFWMPEGTLPGLDNDHHLAVEDLTSGRTHDFWHVTSSGGKVTGWGGGVSMPIDAVQEPFPIAGHQHVGSNAACFPLLAGAVTAADIYDGVIPHALHFSCNHPGPAPNPFPAAAKSEGYPNPGHLPLGSWLRLDPSVNIAGLPRFERILCQALQDYGMFLRDQGSTLLFYGTDLGGGGQGVGLWREAGVAIDPTKGMLAPRLSSSIPWDRLQVLQPPT